MCIFIQEKNSNRYIAFPYNFWLYPDHNPGMKDLISCEISALNFLKEHKMDFNKWIYQGIPYVNDSVEKVLYKKYCTPQTGNNTDKEILSNMNLDSDDSKFIQTIRDQFKKLALEKLTDEYEIPKCNAYLRKIIYTIIDVEFPELVLIQKDENSKKPVNVVKYLSVEGKKSYEEAKQESNLKKFLQKCGFRRVFNELVKSKAIIVGHNLIADIMFTYYSFVGEFPAEFEDFKKQINELFPR